MPSDHAIIELTRASTVVIAAADDTPHGSGFFVAPGRVVTCAHVVRDAGDAPWVRWNGTLTKATVLDRQPGGPVDGKWPAPDAAVLSVEIAQHPSVHLATGPPENGARLYTYGYTRLRRGSKAAPEQDGTFLELEQVAGGSPFHKLAKGTVWPGMSGAPLLDLDQFGVIGVTQSRSTDVVTIGWATPINDALAVYTTEDLGAINGTLDSASIDYFRSKQLGYRRLPNVVASRLTDPMVQALREYLAQQHNRTPSAIPEQHVTEWAARQLFELSLTELIAALKDLSASLGAVAIDMFELVAPCLLIRNVDQAWWISGDAVDRVRAEWDDPPMRILHLTTDEHATCALLLRRTLERKVTIERCQSASTAESTAAGTPQLTHDDVLRALGEALGLREDELSSWKQYADDFRADPRFFSIDPGDDAEVLEAIARDFAGVPFVVCRRTFSPPPSVEGIVRVQPDVDERAERLALVKRDDLARALTSSGINVGAFNERDAR